MESLAMRSGFFHCAGARRENRGPLDCQRGQPAGSVWDRTGAPTGPQTRRRHTAPPEDLVRPRTRRRDPTGQPATPPGRAHAVHNKNNKKKQQNSKNIKKNS